jgi:hypothetical protein
MFHLQDGLHFERLQDGSVRVAKTDGSQGGPVEWEMTVDAGSWASVVADICKQGETAETHKAALEFHNAE